MSHIHIPDGILPVWLILLSWIGAAIVIGWAIFFLRKGDLRKQVPLLGVMSAIMLVGMSTEFIPIGYHINLTVISGIILGPALGFIAAFIVDFILALFGHGGITVVGLNTLVIGTETLLGWLIFRAFYRWFSSHVKSVGLIAGVTTVLTLCISTLLLIGVIKVSQARTDKQFHATILERSDSDAGSIFSKGIIGNILVGGEEEHIHGKERMNIGLFARLVLLIGSIGWIIEATITSVIISFVYRIRRDLILPSN